MKSVRLTEQDIKHIISESVNKILTESFKSNTLRKFFQQHGGVSPDYRQFSLGDISDDQIGYAEEFESFNDAANKQFRLKKQNGNRRSDEDMKYLFHIFVANDGTAMLVGVDRSTIETGIHWGGEHEKKVNDRLWRNGWNPKIRDNRYVDDSDTYYYSRPSNDFGLYNNSDLQNRMSYKKNELERQNPEQRQQFSAQRLKHMRDYLENNYPEIFKKLYT